MINEQNRLNLTHATLALIKSMVGGGVVFLPYIISQTGYIKGFISLIIIGFCSSFSLFFISQSAKETNSKNISELANKIGGRHCFNLINLCILMTIFITLIVSLQMTSFNLESVFKDLGLKIPIEILIITISIINGLMCIIFSSVVKLKIVNIVSLVSIGGLFIYIIFLFFQNFYCFVPKNIIHTNSFLSTLNAIFFISFSFYSQYGFTEISNSIKKYGDIFKAIIYSNVIAGSIYICIGFMGYYLFPNTHPNFLLNSFDSHKIGTMFKAVIGVVNVLGCPFFMITIRNSILCLIRRKVVGFAFKSLCSIGISLICCIITLYLGNKIKILEISFFFFASVVMFILPAYFYLQLFGVKGVTGFFICCNFLLGIIGIVLGFVNLGVFIWDAQM